MTIRPVFPVGDRTILDFVSGCIRGGARATQGWILFKKFFLACFSQFKRVGE